MRRSTRRGKNEGAKTAFEIEDSESQVPLFLPPFFLTCAMLIAWARSVGWPSAYVWKRLARGLEMVLSESVNSLKTKAAITIFFSVSDRQTTARRARARFLPLFSASLPVAPKRKTSCFSSPPPLLDPSREKDAAARNALLVAGACAFGVLVVARRRRCYCCCCCSHQRPRRKADGGDGVAISKTIHPIPSGLGAAGAPS